MAGKSIRSTNVVIVGRQPELLQVVPATHSASRLARGLDSRQQQGDEDPNDRDHDQ
jgi:hypothetical protein